MQERFEVNWSNSFQAFTVILKITEIIGNRHNNYEKISNKYQPMSVAGREQRMWGYA